MFLRFPNPAARIGLVFAAFLLAAGLAYFSIRTAWAAHSVGLGTVAGYQTAVRLEPRNAATWHLLGRYWQYTIEEPDAPRAVGCYRTALALNPRSTDAWMDLAAAYESEGDSAAAADASQQAKRTYPLSAELSCRYENFLLRQGQIPQAFSEIRRAVYVDPKRSAEAFSRCWRVDPDIDAILDNVLPPNADGYLGVIRELGVDRQFSAGLTVWKRLVALHPRLNLEQATPFTNMLIQNHQIADAHAVWDAAVSLSSVAPRFDPPDSLIWDGGFETGLRSGGFAWYFPPISGGMRVALDSRQKQSGQQSLRLVFDGRHNVNFDGLCTYAEVRPGTSYLFSAWVRAQALTTNEGVRFRLTWPQNSYSASLETPNVLGSQPWTRMEMSWTAPKDVREVRVCVLRKASEKFDSQIQGTAWIDDVALVPQAVGSLKP